MNVSQNNRTINLSYLHLCKRQCVVSIPGGLTNNYTGEGVCEGRGVSTVLARGLMEQEGKGKYGGGGPKGDDIRERFP